VEKLIAANIITNLVLILIVAYHIYGDRVEIKVEDYAFTDRKVLTMTLWDKPKGSVCNTGQSYNIVKLPGWFK